MHNDGRDNTEKKPLQAVNGRPVAENENIRTAGRRGGVMLDDTWYLEKMSHFNREVIPERRMHAKGSGAFGTFTVTHDITQYSKAAIFSQIGKQTDMFARFSTVAGERGAADAERDIRGFALKFYTEEGNWDLVGNNTPVFFFRDPMLFPDLNHAVKRDPRTNMRSPQNNWDFWSALPEALHQVTITMGDRGIPTSYRHMHGFGSHTYSLIDAQAADVVAKDRESHQRDLYDAIERGEFPRWKMFIQVMTEEQARNHKDNPFDLTKVWFKGEYPLIEVGYFELNRNPANYYADVEQAAFNPADIVPGISYSPDRMLQGRLFAYGDAQRYRLGVNHQQIPVNRPKVEANSYHRDGAMRVDGNFGSALHYNPNSYGMWKDNRNELIPPHDGEGAEHNYDFRQDDENYYEQPGKLFNLMGKEEQQRLFDNTARNMDGTTELVKKRHIRHCYLADPAYGEGVAKALGIDIASVDMNDTYGARA
jgi:catalase